MALRLRPDLLPLRRGRGAVQLGLSATAGGLIVDGLAPAEVALLEQLAGRLPPPEVYAAAADLGVSDARAMELVALLRAHGLLVEAGPSEDVRPDAGPRNVGRWVVVDGRGALPPAVAALLRGSGVVRVDSGPWAADVADAELRAGRPLTGGPERPDGPHPTGGPVALVVLVGRGGLDPLVGEPWRARGVPLLPVVDDGGRVVVGPLVTSDPALPCLRCLQLARVDRDAHWPEVMAQAAGRDGDRTRDGPADGGPARWPEMLSVAAGVTAMVANAALVADAVVGVPGAVGTRGAGVSGAGVSVEVTAPWPRLDHRRWARHPACPGHARGALDGSGVDHGSARVTMTG
ncbi:MAG: hypothetical protein ABIW80_11410 [Lapillicoccus sp.]